MTLSGSDVAFAAIKDNVIYKAYGGTDLRTFVDCDFNYAYNTDDTDDNDYDAEHLLANRNCTRCPSSMPFSYGYEDDECHACDEFAAGYLINAEPYVQFYYAEACEEAREPVSCEGEADCAPPPEQDDEFSGGGNGASDVDGESGAVSRLCEIVLISASIAVALLV